MPLGRTRWRSSPVLPLRTVLAWRGAGTLQQPAISQNNGILTVGAGSKFDVNGTLTNFSGTTLTGGNYNVTGTLQFNGANIVTNAANITLSGTSSKITDQGGSVNALANFATNSSTGSFTLSGNQALTTTGSFS